MMQRGSTCGLDRIGGRTEFVRGDVRDGPGLASVPRGAPEVLRGYGSLSRTSLCGHSSLRTRESMWSELLTQ